MIVLDTNVVSEAMKVAPHPAVRDWLNRAGRPNAVSVQRDIGGVAVWDRSACGRRKERLTQALDGLLGLFSDRVCFLLILTQRAAMPTWRWQPGRPAEGFQPLEPATSLPSLLPGASSWPHAIRPLAGLPCGRHRSVDSQVVSVPSRRRTQAERRRGRAPGFLGSKPCRHRRITIAQVPDSQRFPERAGLRRPGRPSGLRSKNS